MSILKHRILGSVSSPYVYSYPTTRSYEPLSGFSFAEAQFTRRLNVYIHIPFCEQLCTFCGYFTVLDRSSSFQERYVDAIVAEIGLHGKLLGESIIASVNFGGGTPSLLTGEQLGRIMRALIVANPRLPETAHEISIEATPESVEEEKFSAFHRSGINRVSIGVQSFNLNEIRKAGRHNSARNSTGAVKMLHEIGISNVCVDLMYGIEDQTFQSWKNSVQMTLALRPETVELYGTVSIPGTSFANRAASLMDDEAKLSCYAYASSAFRAAGYRQEAHLRFTLLSESGYQQQANIFRGESLLGIGVAARTYATNVLCRNITGSDRTQVIEEYLRSISSGVIPVRDGIFLSEEEAMRQFVIYRLERLSLAEFSRQFGVSFGEEFSEHLGALIDLGLAEHDAITFSLTPKGLAIRDTIARAFFSDSVRIREEGYYATAIPVVLHKALR